MFKEKLKGILIGSVITSMVFALGITSFAASGNKTISVTYDNIKVYVDDVLSPMQSDGKTVEPFTFQGRTYVPLKAVSESLGSNVDWDDKTNSIYITSANLEGKASYFSDYLFGSYLLLRNANDLQELAKDVINYCLHIEDESFLTQYYQPTSTLVSNRILNNKTICGGLSQYYIETHAELYNESLKLDSLIKTMIKLNISSKSPSWKQYANSANDISQTIEGIQNSLDDTTYTAYDIINY